MFASGNVNQAEKLFLSLLNKFPQDPDIFNNLGVICHTLGRIPEGIDYFSNALEADPIHQDALENILSVYEEKKLWKEAEAVLKKALTLDSTNHKLLNKLALARMESRNREAAITSRQQYNTLQPGQNDLKSTLKYFEHSMLQELVGKNIEKTQNNIGLPKLHNGHENILFIDFNPNTNTHSIAAILNEYGYNVDMAYSGSPPISKLKFVKNPYRKILGITDLDALVEYAKYYAYKNIHIWNRPDSLIAYFKSNNFCVSNILLFNRSFEIIRQGENHKPILCSQPSHDLLNKVSIIIPTYNRPYYLNRVLNYMSNYDYMKPAIIVLDSSERSKLNENKHTIRKHKDILHFEFASDSTFFAKIIEGLESVTTDYVALCADDDYLTEEGIIESIKSLDKDNSLYSVKGKNLYYITSIDNLIEYDWFHGLESSDCIERLTRITNGFVPSLIYQVFRTNKFKKMHFFIQRNFESMPDNNTFREYLFYFMVIATGKVGKIHVDLNIRDKSVPRETEVKNFPHAVMDGTFNDNYKKFVRVLGEYIYEIDGDTQKYDKSISKIFCNFLTNFLKVPQENVIMRNDEFDIEQLEKGMRKSWVWPSNL